MTVITDAEYSGSYTNNTLRTRAVVSYSILSKTNTTITLQVSADIQIMTSFIGNVASGYGGSRFATLKVGSSSVATLDGFPFSGRTVFIDTTNTWKTFATLTSQPFTVTKGTSTQSLVVTDVFGRVVSAENSVDSQIAVGNGATVSLYSIPVKSYTITYNANGGTGGPSSQTKAHGTTLTLASSEPTRSGYTFKEWNTKADGSGTGYDPGDSFTMNADTTLYAKWDMAITSVTIGSATVIRVDSSSSTTESDEGEYAYISVPYTVKGQAAATISMSVTASADTGVTVPTVTSVSNQTKSQGSTKTGTFEAWATPCSTDKMYGFAVTVTAQNTSATQANKTAQRTLALPFAFFTMDVLAGGHGIAFGKPATRQAFDVGMEAYFDQDVNGSGEVSATDENDAVHNLTEKVTCPENADMNVRVTKFTGTTQAYGLRATVTNPNNALVGHEIDLIISNDKLSVYDYTAGSTLFKYDSANTETTTASSIATAASNVTLGSCTYRERNGVAMFSIAFTPSEAISSSTNVFTLASGKRPAVACNGVDTSSQYPCYIQTSGNVQCRRALTADTTYTFRAMYLLA